MSFIHVHYDELEMASKKIECEAQELRACLVALLQRSEQLGTAWEGVAEVEFSVQLQNCIARMRRTPDLFEKLSSDVKRAAALLEAGERAAQDEIRAIVAADG